MNLSTLLQNEYSQPPKSIPAEPIGLEGSTTVILQVIKSINDNKGKTQEAFHRTNARNDEKSQFHNTSDFSLKNEMEYMGFLSRNLELLFMRE